MRMTAMMAPGGGGGGGKVATVTIDPKKRLGDHTEILHRKTSDRIRWRNKDGVDHAIRFTSVGWPFAEPRVDLLVPAGGYSTELTVLTTAIQDSYDYTIVPRVLYSASAGPGGPDGPAVIVNGG